MIMPMRKDARKEARFSEVAEIVTGKTPSTKNDQFFGGDIPFVTPSDLDSIDPIFKTRTQLTRDGALEVKEVPAGSVLVSCIGSLGKVGIAGRSLCTNQQINAIVFDDSRVDPRYGYHYCKTLRPYLERVAPATTLPIINKTQFSKISIPLPILDEQRRISAILDKADMLRAKRNKAIIKLDQLVQSVFLDMFGDPEKNPKKWPIRVIGDLLDSVKYGSSEKAAPEGEVPILRMNNLTYSGEMDLAHLKYITADKAEDKYRVRPGDILFNRTNSRELVGKTAVYTGPEPMAYAGYLVRGRAKAGHAPEYISGFLNSLYGKSILQGMCKSIVGMANINAREFSDIAILVPPHQLQAKFQSIVVKIRYRRELLRRQSNHFDQLFASLQHHAFAGTL